MKIADLQPRDAVTVSTGETLEGAAKRLADDEIGLLVVYGAGGVAGVFSERDLVRAVADGVELDEEQVGDYMTPAPVAVELQSGLGEAISKMNEFGLRHVLVLDAGELVGVVSIRDVMALLGTRWPEL